MSSNTGTGTASALKNLILTRQWKAAFVHLQSHPADASVKLTSSSVGGGKNDNKADMLPLHLACEAQAPPAVIRALLSANASAARIKGGPGGYLPLHYACDASCAQDKVVSLLLTSYRNAASVPTNDTSSRLLPLHVACRSGASVLVIDLVLAAHPEALYVADKDGRFPIDYVKNNTNIIGGGNGNGNKVAIYSALDRAAVYSGISKASAERVREECEAKIRTAAEGHSAIAARLASERDQARSHAAALKDMLEKTDILKEQEKVKKLTEEKALLIKTLQDERASYQKRQNELQSNLDLVKAETFRLTEELNNRQSIIDELTLSKEDIAKSASKLERNLSETTSTLRQTETDLETTRDLSASLRTQLNEAMRTNTERTEQISVLKNSVVELSCKVRSIITEQEKERDVAKARDDAIRSLLLGHESAVRSASDRVEELVRTRIDLDNVARLAGAGLADSDDDNDESEDNDDRDGTNKEEVTVAVNNDDKSKVEKGDDNNDNDDDETDSTASASSESCDSTHAITKHVNVPFEEKELGNLVVEKLS